MLATQESKRKEAMLHPHVLADVVRPQLDALTAFMEQQVITFEDEVQDLVRYCLKNQGKRIRPMLLFFSGWTEPAQDFTDLVRAAAVVELVHLATLVHDDILDDATLRHNLDTVSAKYGCSVAVLLGDALFSQALNLATDFPTVDVCRAVSFSTRRVCAGEIKQTFERGNSDFPLDAYFNVIDFKTAELFRVSCYLGAKMAGYEDAFVTACAAFGRHLGMAYQIFDDIADFLGEEAKIGKTLGTDLESGKYTLPMLLLLQTLDTADRDALIARMQAKEVTVNEICGLLKQHKIHDAVIEHFFAELKAAEQALEGFSKQAPVHHLLQLSRYVTHLVSKLSS